MHTWRACPFIRNRAIRAQDARFSHSNPLLGPRKPQERTPQSRQSPAVDSPGQPHSGPLQLAPSAQ
jgi:hypothetical protein